MKTFIVTLAAILLLMIFPLQNVQDIITAHRIERFDEIVYGATQKARTAGRFTPDIISELKSNINNVFPDISEGEITVDVTTTMKYKRFEFDDRETIHYEIGAPIKKVVSLNKYLGIPDEDNIYFHKLKGYVLSEVLE